MSKSKYTGVYNIEGLPQGTDFDIKIDYQTGDPAATLDLTGYSGTLQVRKNYDSPVLLELTSNDGEITFDSVAPNITISFSHTSTNDMTTYCDMIYDLEITSPGGLVSRPIQGSFSLDRQVTR